MVVVPMQPCFNQAGFGPLLECAIWFTMDRANKARCPCALSRFKGPLCDWYSVPRGCWARCRRLRACSLTTMAGSGPLGTNWLCGRHAASRCHDLKHHVNDVTPCARELLSHNGRWTRISWRCSTWRRGPNWPSCTGHSTVCCNDWEPGEEQQVASRCARALC